MPLTVPTHGQEIVALLRANALKAHAAYKQAWKQQIDLVWNDAKPDEIIAAMGKDAQNFFSDSAAAQAHLEALVPGSTSNLTQRVKTVHFADDGTGTIVAPVNQPAAAPAAQTPKMTAATGMFTAVPKPATPSPAPVATDPSTPPSTPPATPAPSQPSTPNP